MGAILSGYAVHRRRLGVQARIQRLEQQHAIELERARIAKDIHDDIGSSVTHISLMSELASRQADRPGEIKAHMQKISRSTSELFRALDEIIWANNPKEDTLESLISFICKFAQDFLRPADIRCRLDIPETLPHAPLRAEVRHNLFLAVKEAIHNAVKHAAATEVWIRVKIEGAAMDICIEDNGTGLNSASSSSVQGADGLANMKHRLEAIGGRFNLESDPSQGTKLTMNVRF
jgi:signal transduction histidine kinase